MSDTQCFTESNPIKINGITFHIVLIINKLSSTAILGLHCHSEPPLPFRATPAILSRPCHSEPPLSFWAAHCHSERSEESPSSQWLELQVAGGSAALRPSHCQSRPLRERPASGPLPLMRPRVATPPATCTPSIVIPSVSHSSRFVCPCPHFAFPRTVECKCLIHSALRKVIP